MATISLSECKRLAAEAAVASLDIKAGTAVGIGSGSTVVFAVRALEKLCADKGSFSLIRCCVQPFNNCPRPRFSCFARSVTCAPLNKRK